MVEVMLFCPIGKGDGAEKTTEPTNYFIPALGLQKGAVATIVLDNENPHHEKSVYHRKAQGNPVRPTKAEVHQYPERDKGKKGIEDLNNGFTGVGARVLRKHCGPVLQCLLEILFFCW